MRVIVTNNALKPGVSGMMRVKNDGQFVEKCIESCIDALDELIIVWNDCQDNSASEIERMRQQYPDKIKTFEYKYKIYSMNLTREEYEYAKGLPEDSPHLLCNYYNFCLSKVTHKYALKIDADQFYYHNKLAEVCDYLRNDDKARFSLYVAIGFIVFLYLKVVQKLSILFNMFFRVIPGRMPVFLSKCYDTFSKYMLATYSWSISYSGVNIFENEGKKLIPLGKSSGAINILPPFNGVGDLLLFRLSPQCYYMTYDNQFYSKMRGSKYSLIERFVCPKHNTFGGFIWNHMAMNRDCIKEAVRQVSSDNKNRFLEPKKLLKMNFYNINRMVDKSIFQLGTQIYFQSVYSVYKSDIESNL